MITPETFKEFQVAVKEIYGKDLTMQEAEEILRGCVGYFDLLAKIDARSNPPKSE
ncbi:MAG: hypothetical protein NT098_05300 [Candidatus Parcubacteria bacterium]|nr:hypothetical protein [Candidatus Parcubacteria bacterium]